MQGYSNNRLCELMRLIILAILQSLLLCSGQVFLKMALRKMGSLVWSSHFFFSQLTNWWWLGCGLCYGAASVLWMYIVKYFPFSMAYPMVSLSYVFGMLAAILFFHEEVSMVKWMGVACIVVGCFLIAK